MSDLARPAVHTAVRRALGRGRVVALVGPRQAGKTTLARAVVPAGSANYFDLEHPADLARLAEPMTALAPLRGVVVIDEIQRRPDLFPVLRVLADRRPLPARFLVLGSASPGLLQQSSESLAGRLEVIEVGGFLLAETGVASLDRHWRRGGFPRAWLARSERESWAWREQFVRAFLERDVPQLGIGIAAPTLLRFWTMAAHYHGQIWSHAEPARSLGVGEPTIRRYLDALSGVFMMRQLRPWHENLAKRQVKAPKVYVRDSGLLHQLLGIRTHADLMRHPKLGASWEGYVVEQILRTLHPDDAYFWATHGGAELDLLLFHGRRRYGVEIKRTDAPVLTPSMRSALADLGLDRLIVIYPGERRYRLAPRVTAVPVTELAPASWTSLFAA
jgi:uncharacterized protein